MSDYDPASDEAEALDLTPSQQRALADGVRRLVGSRYPPGWVDELVGHLVPVVARLLAEERSRVMRRVLHGDEVLEDD